MSQTANPVCIVTGVGAGTGATVCRRFTREGYRVGLPCAGEWREVLNTDSTYYAGAGIGNMGAVTAEERGWHDQPYSALLTLPPLSVLWLRPS